MRGPSVVLVASAATLLLCAAVPGRAETIPRAAPAAGSVVAVKIGEEINLVEDPDWRGVEVLQDVVPGDVLRTNALGQLAVLFSDRTQVRLGRNTTLVVKELGGGDARFGLESGAIWARAARGGTGVTVDTPAAAAAVRGTDWSLTVGPDGRTSLIVLEGQVELFNAQGSVLVNQGEGASAAIGERPVKFLVVDLDEREQSLFTVSVGDAFSYMVVSPLPTRQILSEYARISALPAEARNAADRVTFAELAFNVDGAVAAREAIAAAREFPLDGAQAARLLFVEAMIAGFDGDFASAAALFERAAPGLGPEQRSIAGYGRYFARALVDPSLAEAPPSPAGGGPYADLVAAYAAAFVAGPKEALRIIRESEARYPEEALLPAMRADFAIWAGDSDEMRDAITTAVALDPDNPVVLRARAQYRYIVESDLDGALADVARAAELKPGDYDIWNLRGQIESDRGAVREAEAAYRRAIELGPNDPLAKINLAVLYLEAGLTDEAGRLVDSALADEPDLTPLFAVRGRLRLQSGDVEGAIEDLLKAGTADPTYTDPLMLLAAAYLQRGDVALARQAMENAARLDPEDPNVAQFASIEAVDAYDADRALVEAREALRRLRARGGAYTALSASREAGSTLTQAFRFLGLFAWGRAYSDVAFDPFDGGTYFDKVVSGESQPFENSTEFLNLGPGPVASDSALSSLVQGLLLYPQAASGGQSLALGIFPQPFFETTVAGTWLQGDDEGPSATVSVNGHANSPFPVSFTGEVTYGEEDMGRSDVDRRVRSAFVVLGAQPTLYDRFAFIGSASGEREPTPGSLAQGFRRDDVDTFTGYGAFGWSHTIGHRNVVTVAGAAGLVDTDTFADRRDVRGIGSTFDLHQPRQVYFGGVNHAVGAGPFTFRYGFEAGRIEGADKVRVSGFNPRPLRPREGETEIGITTLRGYADVTVEASDSLLLEAGLHAVEVDTGGPGGGLDLEPRIGAAWSMFEGHTIRVMASRESAVPGLFTLSPTDTVGIDPLPAPVGAGGRVDTLAARWDAEWSERLFTALEVQHQDLRGISLDLPYSIDSIDIDRGTVDRVSLTGNAWLGHGVGAFGTVAWTRSENTAPGRRNGDDLPFVPEWSARAGLTWVSPLRLRSSIWATWLGERSGDLAGTRLDDVVTVDANLAWESPDRHVTVDLSVFNILDEDFDLATDTPGWGRTFLGTLAVRF